LTGLQLGDGGLEALFELAGIGQQLDESWPARIEPEDAIKKFPPKNSQILLT